MHWTDQTKELLTWHLSGTAGIFYGFRLFVFNQGTISRQKNQAAFLRPRRFMVPAVALATSKITVLLSG